MLDPSTKRIVPRTALAAVRRKAPREFAEAIRTIVDAQIPTPAYEPTFSGYYGDLTAPAALDRFTRYYWDLLDFARVDPARKTVVEAGCGFGVAVILMAALGAEARGVEIVPWMVDFVHEYQPLLPDGLANRIGVVAGTASGMPYEDGSVDLLLSTEAISHYLDYEPFLAEARRVLKLGGTLLVSDGNNGLNPLTRRRTKTIWASHERDPDVLVVGGERYENNPWWLVRKREEIIAGHLPDVDHGVQHELALRTAGMVRAQIIAACDEYTSSARMPTSFYRPGQLSVHPDHEMVMERLFNPFRLKREIEEVGFRARLRGHWGGASGQHAVRLADDLLGALSPVTMCTARAFRIAAVKT